MRRSTATASAGFSGTIIGGKRTDGRKRIRHLPRDPLGTPADASRTRRGEPLRMALLRTLEMLKTGERINDLLYRRTTSVRARPQPTSGTLGSGVMLGQLWRTWSSDGSNEQAIVRMSPASAFR